MNIAESTIERNNTTGDGRQFLETARDILVSICTERPFISADKLLNTL